MQGLMELPDEKTIEMLNFARFPYIDYAGGPSPSLEVILLGINGVEIPTLALIDTGGEFTAMSLALGRQLGVDESRCELVTAEWGIGDRSDQAKWWNDSPEGGAREEPALRVMGQEVPIAPLLREDMDIVVLGRRDFLGSFKFGCDQRVETFTLEAYEEPIEDWMARQPTK